MVINSLQGTPEQKQQMLQQLLALTPAQIDQLPDPTQRAQIRELQLQMAQIVQQQGYR